jgi:hypothetical protein
MFDLTTGHLSKMEIPLLVRPMPLSWISRDQSNSGNASTFNVQLGGQIVLHTQLLSAGGLACEACPPYQAIILPHNRSL